MLEKAGYVPLDDFQTYKSQLEPGGKYYFTKNKSSLVAFAIGKNYKPDKEGGGQAPGFKIIGAHTDSPNLKIKPRSKRSSAGYTQLAVECYGGGLWHTWFDRDLGLSGRVLVRGDDGKITQELVKIDRAVVRIPNLAIHLQTAKEREGFAINKEDHLTPILSMAVKKALETGESASAPEGSANNDVKDGWTEYQEPLLLQMIASELNIDVSKICDFEINLFDVQRASLGGAYSEFIHSGRLDNLASCFMAVRGLLEYTEEDASFDDDADISMIALFDHEEIGSSSATGAGSPIMGEAVERICNAFDADPSSDTYSQSIARSLVLSVDQAHAIHANYASKHEKAHAPKMNDGMVIKRNSNQRYATTGITGFIVREIARKAGLGPIQEFVVRNDCGCGSTIGPIISSNTGMRAIDLGCPQLAMHSIRETMGTSDVANGLNLFKAFFKHFREVDESISGQH